MLAEDDDFEEEEMLKRAIAMSLEGHQWQIKNDNKRNVIVNVHDFLR